MEQSNNPQARALPKPSKMNYACEACRISKVKCQPSSQPGICKRYGAIITSSLVVKEALPPPPGPSKTFSIDFTMPADDDLRDNFDDLREKHERFIDSLVPSSEDEELGDDSAIMSPSAGQMFSFNDLSMPTPSLTTGSTTSTNSRPVSSLAIKPQFNLDSAAKLLESFRSTLPYCPCIVLPDDADVRSMARNTPFVILAILAVTSCSTSLQGHSLYDDEFRKILALKFVAGGERSVELLQGLIIYCSWYPFHLRPKNRQLVQYLRMAVDIVHDLELDEEKDMNLAALSPERREMKLQGIRAYLACFYNVSFSSWTWSKPYSLTYTSWMTKCCDLLEQNSDLQQDHILTWLVRLQHILNEYEGLHRSYKKPSSSDQNEHQRTFVRIGLETQLRDFQSRIPSHLSTTPNILMSSLAADTYILAAPLMQIFHPRSSDAENPLIDAAKLQAATYTTRAFLDYTVTISAEQMGYFSSVDIGRLILIIILAYRLSFPIPSCPSYDYVQGRKTLDFGAVLAKLSTIDNNDGDGKDAITDKNSKKVDVVTAFKVVLGSLRAKFEKKSADLEAAAAAAEESRRARQCPMFDGSLDQYIPLWEGQQSNMNFAGSSYATSSLNGGSAAAAANLAGSAAGLGSADGLAKPTVFHDLWATMTMGWATDGDAGVCMEQGVDMMGLGDAEEYVDIVGVGDIQH
ncbi:uncharacterized protein F4807DRAFT_453273 [Annulohypoxylon truncatum]|uniref:uncharacterized protein n=1 Tax=Annulohypoxylon truncatum TaxID=327061 RepID=UPI0020087D96|nr:uncharacterized protein F4807DRAFT_453273 [Annulohypoxylon truncatum]KAI1206725.1 hypothetical protein F4807DRAFT_453273 [Annulohypoxylon truncatum]